MSINRNFILLLIATFFIAVSTLFVAYNISKVYYKNYTYFYDPIGYMQDNIARHEKINTTSRTQAIIDEIKLNRNNPLTTISLILFTPELLKSKWGHMLTTSVAFVLFIIILGVSVYLRTSNLLYSISLVLLICSIPLFTHPQWGLAAYWLDLQSSLFMGAALLCFMNGVEKISRNWLISFAVFLSFSILSRYIAVVFSLTIFTPLLLSYLLYYYKKWSKEEYLSIIKFLSLSLLVVLLLSGWFLIS